MSTTNQALTNKPGSWSPVRVILRATAIVVVLDGIAGIIYFHTLLKLNPGQFMQWIASAINGVSAFTAGSSTIIEGFIIHVIVTAIMAVVYYFAFKASGLIRKNSITSGIVYGLGIWLVMNLLVFPYSNVPPTPFVLFNAIISIIWHIVLVGIPFAIITNSHFKNSHTTYNR
jgi:uncharacterized membrane protein YagU involved in acid resistance